MLSTGADVLFCGHTHVPYSRIIDEGKLQVRVNREKVTQDICLTAPLQRVINVGSVGEPRHGIANATYVSYDVDTQNVVLREVEYDYQKTCAAIIEKRLPKILAWRLSQGSEFAERADNPTYVCTR